MSDKSNAIELSGGTLKSWSFTTLEALNLAEKYAALGMSPDVMGQRDTPEQTEILCELVDLCDRIWIGDNANPTKEEAKQYLRSKFR